MPVDQPLQAGTPLPASWPAPVLSDSGSSGPCQPPRKRSVATAETRATVQGLNLVRRHTKQTASQDAGIFTKEAPIHLSNLALVDAKGKPTRVGFKIQDDGKLKWGRTIAVPSSDKKKASHSLGIAISADGKRV